MKAVLRGASLFAAGFDLKNYRTSTGMEGEAFSFDLWYTVPGGRPKKVAFVRDDGNGGMVFIDWVRPDKPESKVSAAVQKAKDKLAEIVTSTPKEESYGMTLTVDEGWLMDDLGTAYDLRRKCRRKTLFCVPENEDAIYTCAAPYSTALCARLRKQHGSDIFIINEHLTPSPKAA